MSEDHVHRLALVRGAVGMFCFLLCLATFLFEVVYICRKKKSTTLQRLFTCLTFSNLLYTMALSSHAVSYSHHVDCYLCKVIGFFDQYTGSVQLILTLGIAVKLFHKVFSVCCERKKVVSTKGCLSRHHYFWEALFVVVSFAVPCAVVWFPFTVSGSGSYGIEGPWCWIEILENSCHIDSQSRGFLEQLLLWYVPYAVVCVVSLFCVAAIIVFLVYVCLRHYNKNRRRVVVAIMDMLLLMPFLVVFCLVCFVEVLVVVLLRIDKLNGHLNTYTMWMVYAISTPIGGVVIPIAFFCYFLRQKSQPGAVRLHQVSRAHATLNPSERQSVNSHTSQQDRPRFLTESDVGWETSNASAVVIPHSAVGSLRSQYGSIES
jgi:hypothetical protein